MISFSWFFEDAFFESSSRPHATRKLRNKGASSRSRRLGVEDARAASALPEEEEDGTNSNARAGFLGGVGSSTGGGGISELAGLGMGGSSKFNDMLIMSGLGRVGLEELAGYSDLMSGSGSGGENFENGNGFGEEVTHAQIAARLGLTSVGLGGGNLSSNSTTTGGGGISNSNFNNGISTSGADLGLGLSLSLPTSSSTSGSSNNPLSNLNGSTENPTSLLGLDTGMGDSSYMRGTSTNKSNPIGGGAGATGHAVATNSNITSSKRKGEIDDDNSNQPGAGNGNGTKNPKSTLLTALGGSAGAGLGVTTHGVGNTGTPALRWDVGKSLVGLTAAKDFEVEGDLVNMRKAGGKRRRRG